MGVDVPGTCGDCRYFNPATLHERNKLKAGDPAKGQCRFFAPNPQAFPVFPQVLSDDISCGQSKPKEQ